MLLWRHHNFACVLQYIPLRPGRMHTAFCCQNHTLYASAELAIPCNLMNTDYEDQYIHMQVAQCIC